VIAGIGASAHFALTETGALDLGLTARPDGGELVIERVHPAGWAWYLGLRPGDLVVAVDGRPIDPSDGESLLKTASLVEVRSSSGEHRMVPLPTRTGPTTVLQKLAFLGLAFALAGIGGSVFAIARNLWAPAAFLAFSASGAATLTATVGQASGELWAFDATYVGVVSFGVSTVWLFLKFPVDRLATPWARWLGAAALGIHVGLIGTYLIAITLNSWVYDMLQRATFGVLAADLLIAVAFVVAPLAGEERQRAQNGLRLLGLGVVVALGPLALLCAAPSFVGLDHLMSPEVAILGLAALPAVIGASLLAREFMGIIRFVRRGLVALAVWLALVGALTLTVEVVGEVEAIEPLLHSIPFLLAVLALVFLPIQRMLRGKLEHALFPDVYDYAETLRQISEDLVRVSDVESLTARALRRVGRALNLAWAAITRDGPVHAVLDSWGAPPPGLDAGPGTEARSRIAYSLPLRSGPRVMGRLIVGPKNRDVELSPEDFKMVETVAPMMAAALERTELLGQLREQVATLAQRQRELAALNARLVETQELERSRLALDVHDDPLQRAILLARELGQADGHPAEAGRWNGQIREIITSLRAICAGLEPPLLRDLGLPAGLDWLLGEFRARSEVEASLEVHAGEVQATDSASPERLDPGLELALYRVAQEALNNCAKHADSAHVCIRLCIADEQITLDIEDDGKGFPADGRGPWVPPHLGILGMRERLGLWSGSVEIRAREGGGTQVRASVPRKESDALDLEQPHPHRHSGRSPDGAGGDGGASSRERRDDRPLVRRRRSFVPTHDSRTPSRHSSSRPASP